MPSISVGTGTLAKLFLAYLKLLIDLAPKIIDIIENVIAIIE